MTPPQRLHSCDSATSNKQHSRDFTNKYSVHAPFGRAVAQLLCLGLISTGATATWATGLVRLTTNPGQDISPAWDPRGNTIAYLRSTNASGAGVPYNLYQVQADSPGESVMATGPTSGFGLANSPTWLGSTGRLGLEERASIFEYLTFDSSQAPFARTVSDGGDAAFTRILLESGGGGGGLLKFSRDGSTALWRWSTSGGSGTQEIRVGVVASLTGQAANGVGTVVVSTFHSTDQRLLTGAALSPDGSFFVIALPAAGPGGSSGNPTDLWRYNSDKSGSPVNLTQTAVAGLHNRVPDISPDGQRIIFSRWSGVSGETWDLYGINVDGSGLEQLTVTPHFAEYAPAWSPDGREVAFQGQHLAGFEQTEPALPEGETSNANIYVMDVNALDSIVLPIRYVPGPTNKIEISWPTRLGISYQLRYSDDLSNWSDFGDPIPGTGQPYLLAIPTVPSDGRYFRLAIQR